MTSKAIQKARIRRRVNSGKKRKRALRRFGTTPAFATVFLTPNPSPTKATPSKS